MALTNFYTGAGRAMAPFLGQRAAAELYKDEAAAATSDAVFGTDLSIPRQKEFETALDTSGVNSRKFVEGARAAVLPWLKRAADLMGSTPFRNDAAFRRLLVDDILAENIFVLPRGVSYGAAPSDTDAGVYRRLTVDANGQTIENLVFNEVITVTVMKTVITGAGATQTQVEYRGGSNEGATAIEVKGSGAKATRTLAGVAGCVNSNPTLGGNADTDDGDNITDSDTAGDQTSGGITSWGQTRAGSVTVKVDTAKVYGNQDYGIEVGVASGTLTLEQDMEGLALERGIPVGIMVPVNRTGAWQGSITGHHANKSQAWVHGDLASADTWYRLIFDLDSDLYPENWDNTTYNKFKLVIANGAGASTNTLTLGGFYVAKMFQLVKGGAWHVCWEYQTAAQQDDEVSFGADSVTESRGFQSLWCAMYPEGPSLPVTGSTEWVPTAPTAQPEISVRRNGSNVADGGTVALGATSTAAQNVTLRIQNNGYTALAIGVPTQGSVSNATVTSFGISQPRAILPGHYYDLVVQVTPAGVGAYSAEVIIGNNDASEAPYNVTITGTAS